jgi:hypothetical protein
MHARTQTCTSVSDHAREQNDPEGHSAPSDPDPLAEHGAMHWPVAMPQVPHSVPAGHGWLASHATPISSIRGFAVSEPQLAIRSRSHVIGNRMDRL